MPLYVLGTRARRSQLYVHGGEGRYTAKVYGVAADGENFDKLDEHNKRQYQYELPIPKDLFYADSIEIRVTGDPQSISELPEVIEIWFKTTSLVYSDVNYTSFTL